jgi:hypothetical protein
LEDYNRQAILSECWTIVILKTLSILKPDGCRRVGRPKPRWMDGIEDDHRMLSVREWRRRALDRREQKNIVTI